MVRVCDDVLVRGHVECVVRMGESPAAGEPCGEGVCAGVDQCRGAVDDGVDTVAGVQDGGGAEIYERVLVCAGECDMSDYDGTCDSCAVEAKRSRVSYECRLMRV